MSSQLELRGLRGGRSRLLQGAATDVTYHVFGGADLPIRATWAEEAHERQEAERGVDSARTGVLQVSVADVASPQIRRDRVTIDGDVWTVIRSLSRGLGLVNLACEIRDLVEVRRGNRER
ncbi:MAG: hypothetical protein HYV27_15295 [Candidatus Hydrogenedentes bacterium]|nr:hypothetical protein [Candidatus Hydrogenedentota bacterium]